MTWQRYLTDAELRYRPEAMRALYRYPLRFTIKGVEFIRWFRSVQDRDRYAGHDLPSGTLARLIDHELESDRP